MTQINVNISDEHSNSVPIDQSGGLVVTPAPLWDSRSRSSFAVGLNQEGVADDGGITLLMTREVNDPVAHARIFAASGGLSRLRIDEGADVTAAGAAATGQNLHRQATVITPQITVTSGPTLGMGGFGTPLTDELIPPNMQVAAAGGSEFVFYAERQTITILNLDGAAQWLSLMLVWSEHPDPTP